MVLLSGTAVRSALNMNPPRRILRDKENARLQKPVPRWPTKLLPQ